MAAEETDQKQQVKRRQSQTYKFKKFAKISNFWILKRALHETHLLKLLDKMCKYEMDPMSIVEDTERTRFCPQMDRRTDGQGDTSIPPPFNFVEAGGINTNQENTQIARLMGPTWAIPGSCRSQVGPMLAPWTLLSGQIIPQLSCYIKQWEAWTKWLKFSRYFKI